MVETIIRWGGDEGEQYFNFPPQSETRGTEREGRRVGWSWRALQGTKTHISSSSPEVVLCRRLSTHDRPAFGSLRKPAGGGEGGGGGWKRGGVAQSLTLHCWDLGSDFGYPLSSRVPCSKARE